MNKSQIELIKSIIFGRSRLCLELSFMKCEVERKLKSYKNQDIKKKEI